TWRTISRTDWPVGTSVTPTRASRSAKSGGAHTRTSVPIARSAPANPTIGSTSPRDPYVDNNTRTCRPHSRRFWVQPAIMRHDPGLAASPLPCYRLILERTGASPFCWDDNACRLAAQPSPASQAPSATVVYGRYGGGVPLPPSNGGCVPPAHGAGRRGRADHCAILSRPASR